MSTPEDKKHQKAENRDTHHPSATMATKKPRLTIYLETQRKEYLEQWAKSEKRTLTNLVGLILDEAIDRRREAETEKEERL